MPAELTIKLPAFDRKEAEHMISIIKILLDVNGYEFAAQSMEDSINEVADPGQQQTLS